jgi:RNA 2',3'-cyclic 3'-phosphodiesterase
MQVFSALFPPPQVVESLRAELAGLWAEFPQPRWTPADQWHVTLGFYGEDDDIPARVDWLRKRLAGLPGPALRLEGAGTFSRVLYLGVYSESLTELAEAAGAGQDRPYLPHLTLARTQGDVPRELPRRLSGYSSQEWTATEAVLMRSDRTESGPRYSIVERLSLAQQTW